MTTDYAQTFENAASLVEAGDILAAQDYVNKNYPFNPNSKRYHIVDELGLPRFSGTTYPAGPKPKRVQRSFAEKTRLFRRDGYQCGYTGQRLINPGAIIMLSRILPEAIPCLKNPNQTSLKRDHSAFFFLWPAIDHIVPLRAGGEDCEENMTITNHGVNSYKSASLLEDIGWPQPIRRSGDWDGLEDWLRRMAKQFPEHNHSQVADWVGVL